MKSRVPLVLVALSLLTAGLLWVVHGWLIRSVLPNVLRTQLTAALKRDVSFGSVDTNLISYISVKDLVVAKGTSVREGSAVAVKEVIIKYKLIRLLLAPKSWPTAITRVEVVEPRVELAHEEVFPKPAPGKPRLDHEGAVESGPAAALPLPKTFMRVTDGTITLTRFGRPVLEVKRFGGNLDLRGLPRIEGSVKFVVAPEGTLVASGFCHLGLRTFKGELSIDRLALGQFSDLARLADPELAVGVGGRLTAELNVKGGFMTLDELIGKTTGRGSLKLDNGSLTVRGSPLVTEVSAAGALNGRQIVLERLGARVFSGALNAAGSLENLGLGKLRLNGILEQVPVQALQALAPGLPDDLEGQVTFEFSATGTGRAPLFYGRLTAPELGIPGVLAKDVVAEAGYSAGTLKLTNLTARLWEGIFAGEGTLRALATGVQELDFSLKGEGVNVARSPLGHKNRFTGRADLSVNLQGPLSHLTGVAHAALTKVRAKGVPVGNLVVDAQFKGGKIVAEAWTVNRTVVATGTIVVGDGARCEGCQVDVQERLPLILALAGVTLPKSFAGRASGKILIEGPLTKLVITIEAIGTGVRFGKLVLGDQIWVPKLVYRNKRLEVPEETPLELFWDLEDTRVTVHGAVPIAVFSKEGQEPIALHLECVKGRMDVLRRLGLIKRADGEFAMTLDLGGTTSYPSWSYTLAGSGGRIELNGHLFGKPITHWNLDARMRESEGIIRITITVDKQSQVLNGRFSMAGWKLGELDLNTWTEAASGSEEDIKGLPLSLEGVAQIRARLIARLIKGLGDDAILITGQEEGQPAELHLSSGVIRYSGMVQDRPEPARRDPVAEWAQRTLNIQGLMTCGEDVTYKPKTFLERGWGDIFKAVGSEEATFKEIGKRYVSLSGLKEIVGGLSVGFDVRIKEGSALKIAKRGDQVAAKGKLLIEAGGRLSLAHHDFTVVSEAGKENYIEFEGDEELQANVNVTGETVLYGQYLFTPTRESAFVEELPIRLMLTPLSPSELARRKKKPFLNFNYRLMAEPPMVVGEVAASAAADRLQDEPASSRQLSRSVLFIPDEITLFGALTGQQALVAAIQEGELKSQAASAGGRFIVVQLGAFVVKLFTWPLNLVGLKPDVSVRKSKLARRRREAARRQQALSPATQATPRVARVGGEQSIAASVLDDTELTIGKRFAKNFYFNWSTILLDSSRLVGRPISSLDTRPYGFITELAYRTSRYKGTLKARWFGLPDDPDEDRRREFFVGGEMNQSFRGVSQRETFEW